jgi:hypothetical protein
MAPLANAAIVGCAIAAESILTTVRIAGVEPKSSESFDARRLLEPADSDDRAWRI